MPCMDSIDADLFTTRETSSSVYTGILRLPAGLYLDFSKPLKVVSKLRVSDAGGQSANE